MTTEIDPKQIYQKILKPFLKNLRNVFIIDDIYQRVVSINVIADDLQKNIMFCIFFEKLFKDKINKSDLILQVIVEIKQNILNFIFLYQDMFKNLHKVKEAITRQTGPNKNEINLQIKKFTNNIAICVLQFSWIKFFFAHKVAQFQEEDEKKDIEDQKIQELVAFCQTNKFNGLISLQQQFSQIQQSLQTDYLEMQRIENLSTGFYFRDNVDKYISYFNNVKEFYECQIFIFKYMQQQDKNQIYKQRVFQSMNVDLIFYITDLKYRVKENIEDLNDEQLEKKFQKLQNVMQSVAKGIFIFVNMCYDNKLLDQKNKTKFKQINYASELIPLLRQQFEHLHKTNSGSLFNRSIRIKATKFYLYNLKCFPDQITQTLKKFDIKSLQEIRYPIDAKMTNQTIYDLYKELKQYFDTLKGFLRKDLKNKEKDEEKQEKIDNKQKEDIEKEQNRDRIYSDAIAQIFQKADQIKDEEEEEMENFQVIDQGNMYEDEYDDTLDRLDGQKLERKDSNDRLEIDFGEDDEEEEKNNINNDPPQNFKKKVPIKTWDDDFEYKSQFQDNQQQQQSKEQKNQNNRGYNKNNKYTYKQKNDQNDQYNKVTQSQNDNNYQGNKYNKYNNDHNQESEDNRNNNRGRGNYRGKNNYRGRGRGRGRGNQRGRGQKNRYNDYKKKED